MTHSIITLPVLKSVLQSFEIYTELTTNGMLLHVLIQSSYFHKWGPATCWHNVVVYQLTCAVPEVALKRDLEGIMNRL